MLNLLRGAFFSGTRDKIAEQARQQLTEFAQRMTFAGWAADGETNHLDVAVLLNTRNPMVGKTLDGKFRFTVRGGVLPVYGLWSFGKITLPVYQLPGNAPQAFGANDMYHVREVLRKAATTVATEMGVACDFSMPNDLALTCETDLGAIYGRMLGFDVVACPEAGADSCVDLNGRKVQVVHASKGPDRRRGERVEPVVRAALARLLGQSGVRAVDEQSAQPVRATLNFNLERGAPIMLMPRNQVDPAKLEQQGYTVLGWLTTTALIEQAGELQSKRLEASEQRAAERDKALAAIDGASATDDLWGAVRVAADAEAICTLRAGAGEESGWMRQALLRTGEFTRFRAAKDDRSRLGFARQANQTDELYLALQTRRCSMVVERAGVLKPLIAAMQRDKIAFEVMPALLGEPALAEVQAVALGFRSAADWKLAQSLGAGSQGEVERLAGYGITSRQQVDDALGRMRAGNYAQGRDSLMQFLADEAEGRKTGQSAFALREQRQREAARREAQAVEEQARQYPYIATLSCGMQGRHLNILACFAAGSKYGAETALELRNGEQYGLYKVHEISRLGSATPNGLVIDLASNFMVKAQNSSENLILGLTITDRRTGRSLFSKQVDRYGVISIKNP